MTETELLELLMEFFGDTSRSPAETKAGLIAVADRANELADTIPKRYKELLMAVGKKYPGESRHETALRYIRRAENQCNGPDTAIAKESI